MKFKLNIKKGIGILVLAVVTSTSYAQQDPMYTQYFFNTQTINPAYTGTWQSLGFMALARHQWMGWDGAPRTYTFSMQAPMRNDKVALGLNVINDNIFKEKRFGIWADYSYKVIFDENTNLRMGLKGGFTNYSNNLLSYELIDPNDPLFQGDLENKFIPNFGAGLFLSNPKYFLGFSVPKLLHTELKEEENLNNFSMQAEFRHFYLQGGMIFNLSEFVRFKPTFMAKALKGVPPQFDFTANFLLADKFWLGAMFRTKDAYGFIAQWIFNNELRVGYAVDFSTSKLQNFHHGSHEIMISYELKTLKELVVSPRFF